MERFHNHLTSDTNPGRADLKVPVRRGLSVYKSIQKSLTKIVLNLVPEKAGLEPAPTIQMRRGVRRTLAGVLAFCMFFSQINISAAGPNDPIRNPIQQIDDRYQDDKKFSPNEAFNRDIAFEESLVLSLEQVLLSVDSPAKFQTALTSFEAQLSRLLDSRLTDSEVGTLQAVQARVSQIKSTPGYQSKQFIETNLKNPTAKIISQRKTYLESMDAFKEKGVDVSFATEMLGRAVRGGKITEGERGRFFVYLNLCQAELKVVDILGQVPVGSELKPEDAALLGQFTAYREFLVEAKAKCVSGEVSLGNLQAFVADGFAKNRKVISLLTMAEGFVLAGAPAPQPAQPAATVKTFGQIKAMTVDQIKALRPEEIPVDIKGTDIATLSQDQKDAIRKVRLDGFTTRLGTVAMVSYNPAGGYNPNGGVVATEATIRADLQVLHDQGVRGINTYGSDNGLDLVPKIAKDMGFKIVVMGVWDPTNQLEVNKAIAQSEYVDAYVVGNEGVSPLDKIEGGKVVIAGTRGTTGSQAARYTVGQLETAIKEIRDKTCKPVTTAEEVADYLDMDSKGVQTPTFLVKMGDFVFPNVHPYWASIRNANQAVQYVVGEYDSLQRVSGSTFVYLRETGFPTAKLYFDLEQNNDGSTSRVYKKSPEEINETRQRDFYVSLSQQKIGFSYFEPFDQSWKLGEGTMVDDTRGFDVGPFWGFYDKDRKPKLLMRDYKFDADTGKLVNKDGSPIAGVAVVQPSAVAAQLPAGHQATYANDRNATKQITDNVVSVATKDAGVGRVRAFGPQNQAGDFYEPLSKEQARFRDESRRLEAEFSSAQNDLILAKFVEGVFSDQGVDIVSSGDSLNQSVIKIQVDDTEVAGTFQFLNYTAQGETAKISLNSDTHAIVINPVYSSKGDGGYYYTVTVLTKDEAERLDTTAYRLGGYDKNTGKCPLIKIENPTIEIQGLKAQGKTVKVYVGEAGWQDAKGNSVPVWVFVKRTDGKNEARYKLGSYEELVGAVVYGKKVGDAASGYSIKDANGVTVEANNGNLIRVLSGELKEHKVEFNFGTEKVELVVPRRDPSSTVASQGGGEFVVGGYYTFKIGDKIVYRTTDFELAKMVCERGFDKVEIKVKVYSSSSKEVTVVSDQQYSDTPGDKLGDFVSESQIRQYLGGFGVGVYAIIQTTDSGDFTLEMDKRNKQMNFGEKAVEVPLYGQVFGGKVALEANSKEAEQRLQALSRAIENMNALVPIKKNGNVDWGRERSYALFVYSDEERANEYVLDVSLNRRDSKTADLELRKILAGGLVKRGETFIKNGADYVVQDGDVVYDARYYKVTDKIDEVTGNPVLAQVSVGELEDLELSRQGVVICMVPSACYLFDEAGSLSWVAVEKDPSSQGRKFYYVPGGTDPSSWVAVGEDPSSQDREFYYVDAKTGQEHNVDVIYLRTGSAAIKYAYDRALSDLTVAKNKMVLADEIAKDETFAVLVGKENEIICDLTTLGDSSGANAIPQNDAATGATQDGITTQMKFAGAVKISVQGKQYVRYAFRPDMVTGNLVPVFGDPYELALANKDVSYYYLEEGSKAESAVKALLNKPNVAATELTEFAQAQQKDAELDVSKVGYKVEFGKMAQDEKLARAQSASQEVVVREQLQAGLSGTAVAQTGNSIVSFALAPVESNTSKIKIPEGAYAAFVCMPVGETSDDIGKRWTVAGDFAKRFFSDNGADGYVRKDDVDKILSGIREGRVRASFYEEPVPGSGDVRGKLIDEISVPEYIRNGISFQTWLTEVDSNGQEHESVFLVSSSSQIGLQIADRIIGRENRKKLADAYRQMDTKRDMEELALLPEVGYKDVMGIYGRGRDSSPMAQNDSAGKYCSLKPLLEVTDDQVGAATTKFSVNGYFNSSENKSKLEEVLKYLVNLEGGVDPTKWDETLAKNGVYSGIMSDSSLTPEIRDEIRLTVMKAYDELTKNRTSFMGLISQIMRFSVYEVEDLLESDTQAKKIWESLLLQIDDLDKDSARVALIDLVDELKLKQENAVRTILRDSGALDRIPQEAQESSVKMVTNILRMASLNPSTGMPPSFLHDYEEMNKQNPEVIQNSMVHTYDLAVLGCTFLDLGLSSGRDPSASLPQDDVAGGTSKGSGNVLLRLAGLITQELLNNPNIKHKDTGGYIRAFDSRTDKTDQSTADWRVFLGANARVLELYVKMALVTGVNTELGKKYISEAKKLASFIESLQAKNGGFAHGVNPFSKTYNKGIGSVGVDPTTGVMRVLNEPDPWAGRNAYNHALDGTHPEHFICQPLDFEMQVTEENLAAHKSLYAFAGLMDIVGDSSTAGTARAALSKNQTWLKNVAWNDYKKCFNWGYVDLKRPLEDSEVEYYKRQGLLDGNFTQDPSDEKYYYSRKTLENMSENSTFANHGAQTENTPSDANILPFLDLSPRTLNVVLPLEQQEALLDFIWNDFKVEVSYDSDTPAPFYLIDFYGDTSRQKMRGSDDKIGFTEQTALYLLALKRFYASVKDVQDKEDVAATCLARIKALEASLAKASEAGYVKYSSADDRDVDTGVGFKTPHDENGSLIGALSVLAGFTGQYPFEQLQASGDAASENPELKREYSTGLGKMVLITWDANHKEMRATEVFHNGSIETNSVQTRLSNAYKTGEYWAEGEAAVDAMNYWDRNAVQEEVRPVREYHWSIRYFIGLGEFFFDIGVGLANRIYEGIQATVVRVFNWVFGLDTPKKMTYTASGVASSESAPGSIVVPEAVLDVSGYSSDNEYDWIMPGYVKLYLRTTGEDGRPKKQRIVGIKYIEVGGKTIEQVTNFDNADELRVDCTIVKGVDAFGKDTYTIDPANRGKELDLSGLNFKRDDMQKTYMKYLGWFMFKQTIETKSKLAEYDLFWNILQTPVNMMGVAAPALFSIPSYAMPFAKVAYDAFVVWALLDKELVDIPELHDIPDYALADPISYGQYFKDAIAKLEQRRVPGQQVSLFLEMITQIATAFAITKDQSLAIFLSIQVFSRDGIQTNVTALTNVLTKWKYSQYSGIVTLMLNVENAYLLMSGKAPTMQLQNIWEGSVSSGGIGAAAVGMTADIISKYIVERFVLQSVGIGLNVKSLVNAITGKTIFDGAPPINHWTAWGVYVFGFPVFLFKQRALLKALDDVLKNSYAFELNELTGDLGAVYRSKEDYERHVSQLMTSRDENFRGDDGLSYSAPVYRSRSNPSNIVHMGQLYYKDRFRLEVETFQSLKKMHDVRSSQEGGLIVNPASEPPILDVTSDELFGEGLPAGSEFTQYVSEHFNPRSGVVFQYAGIGEKLPLGAQKVSTESLVLSICELFNSSDPVDHQKANAIMYKLLGGRLQANKQYDEKTSENFNMTGSFYLNLETTDGQILNPDTSRQTSTENDARIGLLLLSVLNRDATKISPQQMEELRGLLIALADHLVNLQKMGVLDDVLNGAVVDVDSRDEYKSASVAGNLMVYKFLVGMRKFACSQGRVEEAQKYQDSADKILFWLSKNMYDKQKGTFYKRVDSKGVFDTQFDYNTNLLANLILGPEILNDLKEVRASFIGLDENGVANPEDVQVKMMNLAEDASLFGGTDAYEKLGKVVFGETARRTANFVDPVTGKGVSVTAFGDNGTSVLTPKDISLQMLASLREASEFYTIAIIKNRESDWSAGYLKKSEDAHERYLALRTQLSKLVVTSQDDGACFIMSTEKPSISDTEGLWSMFALRGYDPINDRAEYLDRAPNTQEGVLGAQSPLDRLSDLWKKYDRLDVELESQQRVTMLGLIQIETESLVRGVKTFDVSVSDADSSSSIVTVSALPRGVHKNIYRTEDQVKLAYYLKRLSVYDGGKYTTQITAVTNFLKLMYREETGKTQSGEQFTFAYFVSGMDVADEVQQHVRKTADPDATRLARLLLNDFESFSSQKLRSRTTSENGNMVFELYTPSSEEIEGYFDNYLTQTREIKDRRDYVLSQKPMPSFGNTSQNSGAKAVVLQRVITDILRARSNSEKDIFFAAITQEELKQAMIKSGVIKENDPEFFAIESTETLLVVLRQTQRSLVDLKNERRSLFSEGTLISGKENELMNIDLQIRQIQEGWQLYDYDEKKNIFSIKVPATEIFGATASSSGYVILSVQQYASDEYVTKERILLSKRLALAKQYDSAKLEYGGLVTMESVKVAGALENKWATKEIRVFGGASSEQVGEREALYQDICRREELVDRILRSSGSSQGYASLLSSLNNYKNFLVQTKAEYAKGTSLEGLQSFVERAMNSEMRKIVSAVDGFGAFLASTDVKAQAEQELALQVQTAVGTVAKQLMAEGKVTLGSGAEIPEYYLGLARAKLQANDWTWEDGGNRYQIIYGKLGKYGVEKSLELAGTAERNTELYVRYLRDGGVIILNRDGSLKSINPDTKKFNQCYAEFKRAVINHPELVDELEETGRWVQGDGSVVFLGFPYGKVEDRARIREKLFTEAQTQLPAMSEVQKQGGYEIYNSDMKLVPNASVNGAPNQPIGIVVGKDAKNFALGLYAGLPAEQRAQIADTGWLMPVKGSIGQDGRFTPDTNGQQYYIKIIFGIEASVENVKGDAYVQENDWTGARGVTEQSDVDAVKARAEKQRGDQVKYLEMTQAGGVIIQDLDGSNPTQETGDDVYEKYQAMVIEQYPGRNVTGNTFELDLNDGKVKKIVTLVPGAKQAQTHLDRVGAAYKKADEANRRALAVIQKLEEIKKAIGAEITKLSVVPSGETPKDKAIREANLANLHEIYTQAVAQYRQFLVTAKVVFDKSDPLRFKVEYRTMVPATNGAGNQLLRTEEYRGDFIISRTDELKKQTTTYDSILAEKIYQKHGVVVEIPLVTKETKDGVVSDKVLYRIAFLDNSGTYTRKDENGVPSTTFNQLSIASYDVKDMTVETKICSLDGVAFKVWVGSLSLSSDQSDASKGILVNGKRYDMSWIRLANYSYKTEQDPIFFGSNSIPVKTEVYACDPKNGSVKEGTKPTNTETLVEFKDLPKIIQTTFPEYASVPGMLFAKYSKDGHDSYSIKDGFGNKLMTWDNVAVLEKLAEIQQAQGLTPENRSKLLAQYRQFLVTASVTIDPNDSFSITIEHTSKIPSADGKFFKLSEEKYTKDFVTQRKDFYRGTITKYNMALAEKIYNRYGILLEIPTTMTKGVESSGDTIAEYTVKFLDDKGREITADTEGVPVSKPYKLEITSADSEYMTVEERICQLDGKVEIVKRGRLSSAEVTGSTSRQVKVGNKSDYHVYWVDIVEHKYDDTKDNAIFFGKNALPSKTETFVLNADGSKGPSKGVETFVNFSDLPDEIKNNFPEYGRISGVLFAKHVYGTREIFSLKDGLGNKLISWEAVRVGLDVSIAFSELPRKVQEEFNLQQFSTKASYTRRGTEGNYSYAARDKEGAVIFYMVDSEAQLSSETDKPDFFYQFGSQTVSDYDFSKPSQTPIVTKTGVFNAAKGYEDLVTRTPLVDKSTGLPKEFTFKEVIEYAEINTAERVNAIKNFAKLAGLSYDTKFEAVDRRFKGEKSVQGSHNAGVEIVEREYYLKDGTGLGPTFILFDRESKAAHPILMVFENSVCDVLGYPAQSTQSFKEATSGSTSYRGVTITHAPETNEKKQKPYETGRVVSYKTLDEIEKEYADEGKHSKTLVAETENILEDAKVNVLRCRFIRYFQQRHGISPDVVVKILSTVNNGGEEKIDSIDDFETFVGCVGNFIDDENMVQTIQKDLRQIIASVDYTNFVEVNFKTENDMGRQEVQYYLVGDPIWSQGKFFVVSDSKDVGWDADVVREFLAQGRYFPKRKYWKSE